LNAIEQGATVVTGGHRPPHLSAGWFYEPTVITTTPDSDIMHGECYRTDL
jgi:betaine-aldehyde dehydrogenase